MLTKEEIQSALPIHLKNAATQGLVEALNEIPVDPIYAENIRENFITYTSVLKDSKYKMEDYLNAIAYVTFRFAGFNNQESYIRTFPQRYAELVAKGKSSKEISSYVAMYNKNQLVQKIMEQSMIPVWLMNQDIMQRAINKQVELMDGAKSEMVQMQAAKALMEILKKPEAKEVNVNLGAVEDKGVDALRELMEGLASKQKEMIAGGMGTREIAHQTLIDVTPQKEGQ